MLLLALRETCQGCDDLYKMLSLATHHVLKQNILEVLCIMERERGRKGGRERGEKEGETKLDIVKGVEILSSIQTFKIHKIIF